MIDEKIHEVAFWPGNPLSYTTTRLELFRDDIFLSFATGFIFQFGSAYGLVTNFHALSGVNPATGMTLSNVGAIPNRVDFHIAVQTTTYRDNKIHEEIFFKPMSVELDSKDGIPVWFDDRATHPHNDYAILRLEPYLPELAEPGVTLRSILGGQVTLRRGIEKPDNGRSKYRSDEIQNFFPPVGDRIFVLGYPKGITSTGIFPIWKGATIASEPFSDVTLGEHSYNNLFYIDAMTKAGMSGAPVVAIGRTDASYYTADGVRIAGKIGSDFLLGVYAGRDGLTQEEYELSLGRVWKVSAIEMLFARTIAAVPIIRRRPPLGDMPSTVSKVSP